MNIVKIKNSDKNFYTLMGKFLSKRYIVKEIGNNIWDDDMKEWYICIQNNKILGFISLLKYKIESFYVISEYRYQGVGNLLLENLIKDNKQKKLLAIATKNSLNLFLKNNFKIINKKGKYFRVEKLGVNNEF